jgi:hypothetical protein
MNIKNEPEVVEAIRYECFKLKGQKNFAKTHKVSQSNLSLVINGKRTPSEEMIKAAGYELRYVKTEES